MIKKKKNELKSGFVVLVGCSNVGKSTLLNNLVGTKVAITSPKPQTTRYIIQGVLHDSRGQAVFIDTPGIFQKTYDQLASVLTKKAKGAIKNADLILYVVDPTRAPGKEENTIFNLLQSIKIPKLLVVNKIDLREKPYLEDYQDWREDLDDYIEISALKQKHLKPLVDLIFKYLPEGQPYYPEFQFSNVEEKFWLAELIREKIFLLIRQEIPYSVKVEIEEIKERTVPDLQSAKTERGLSPNKKELLYIKANIFTTKQRYRQILIGEKGQKIKEIGQMARKEIEQALNKKVYLDLEIKIDSHWQERFI